MNRVKFVLAVSVLLGLVSWLSFPLAVSQADFRLDLRTGTSSTFSFRVYNDEAIVDRVKVYVGDWDRDISGANRFYEPGTLARSAANWITVSPAEFELKPNETKEVRFTIDVPMGIEGTYWGMIFIEGRPRLVQQGPTAAVAVPRIGIKVYETPPGTARKNGRISELERLGLNPLRVRLEFENTGNCDLVVEGWMEIRDGRGATLERIPIGRFPILPEAKRELFVTSVRAGSERLSPGSYIALAVLDFGGDFLVARQLPIEIRPLNLRPIGGSPNLPQDLDSDGLYEDVNGDGLLTVEDGSLLEASIETAEVQDNWWAFDFDNDGDADLTDVEFLKRMIAEKERS